MDDFIKNALNSKFSEEISKCLDIKINNNLRLDYERKKKMGKTIFKHLQELDINFNFNKIVENEYFKIGVEAFSKSLADKYGIVPLLIVIGASIAIIGIMAGVDAIKNVYAKKKEEKEKEQKYLKNIMFYKDEEFYCDSLYYGYLPERFRKKYIPTLKWNNKLQKAKSVAIELIIDEDFNDPNFLIINIPGDSLEINEFSHKGDIINYYNGIPENAFSAYFILYMFDKDKLDLESFKKIRNQLQEENKDIESLISSKIIKII